MPRDSRRQSPLLLWVALPLARVFLGLLMVLLGPWRSFGKRKVPRSGGLLVLSNHLADVDPILVQLTCPRPLYFMAKSELFSMPVVGAILRWYRAFPVNRGEADRAAIKHAVELMKDGNVVCVFPEGELAESGTMQELKPGVALMVRMAEVPVVCVAVRNTNRVMPYGKVLPRPAWAWVTATWGEPRTFEKHASTEDIMGWAEAELKRLGAP